MPQKLIMIMGVQRSGTTALLEAFSHGCFIAIDEVFPEYYDRDHFLRPEPEIRPLLGEWAGTVLLKPISETLRRSVLDVIEEYKDYDLQIVWIYRDPVNAIRSQQTFGFKGRALSVPELAQEWSRRNESVLECLPRFQNRVTIVNYEDLATCPGLLLCVGERLGIQAAPSFRADSGSGRKAMPREEQALVDQVTRAVRARMDKARTLLPRPGLDIPPSTHPDIYSQTFLQRPLDYFKEWRKQAPVHYLTTPNSCLVLSHADVATIINDEERFSCASYRLYSRFLGKKPTERARTNEVLEPLLTPDRLRIYADQVGAHTRRILAELADRRAFDAVADFADRLKTQMQSAFGRDDGVGNLLSEVWTASRLPSKEVADLKRSLAVLWASTAKSIAVAVYYLVANREWQERLRADPRDAQIFIKEALRLGPPWLTVRRDTLVPVKIGECRLPAGAHVYVAIAAANRDPELYERPEEFNPEGQSSQQPLSENGGCGWLEILVNAERQAVLRILLTEFPPLDANCAVANVPFGGSPQLWGPADLPVRWRQ
jgi:cytochrome P450